MIPEVSAGSNHVGASVTCTAQVSWPSGGPAARIEHGTPSTKAAARRATTSRRTRADRFALPKDCYGKKRERASRPSRFTLPCTEKVRAGNPSASSQLWRRLGEAYRIVLALHRVMTARSALVRHVPWAKGRGSGDDAPLPPQLRRNRNRRLHGPLRAAGDPWQRFPVRLSAFIGGAPPGLPCIAFELASP